MLQPCVSIFFPMILFLMNKFNYQYNLVDEIKLLCLNQLHSL